MTIIVGETERAALKAAMARARAHPVPWDVLQRGIVDRSGALRIEDRAATHKRPSREFLDLRYLHGPQTAAESGATAVDFACGFGLHFCRGSGRLKVLFSAL